MKFATAAVFILTAVPAVLACCKQKGLTSCCGKGKCNIFCCNCDGGCKPKEECNGISLPICWVSGTKVICARSLGGNNSSAVPAVSSELADLVEGTLGSSAAGLSPEERQAEDVKVFSQVDVDGKGFFTYGEFLDFAGETDSAELQEYFAKYDKNGDGGIAVEEMRLD